MTGAPTDLRPDTTTRGPHGTELAGVSVALPLKEVQDWTQEDWSDAVRNYQPEMLEMLRRHVGDARPRTMPQLTVDGPHSDPLQGLLYVMTCAAWFKPEDFPPDSPAYVARAQGRPRG
jgi:hypothetical protein